MPNNREQSIVVTVRVRPLNDREKRQGSEEAWETDQNSIIQTVFPKRSYASSGKGKQQFNASGESIAYPFDHVFPTSSRSDTIFATAVQEVVVSSMEGHHAAVFA